MTNVNIESFLESREFKELVKQVAIQMDDSVESVTNHLSTQLRSGRLYFDKNYQMRLNPSVPQ